jgi:TonB family protein
MLDALREFETSARDAEVALFYFAGHGAQINGANFLLPVGSQIQGDADVVDEAIDATTVLRRIEATRARVGLVILDACRDNPYPGSMRSAARGLARMPAPTGTIVAYATAPGSTADDGSGSHGVYTSALARQLVIPGLDIKEVFDRAAQEVERVTGGRQKPREEIGLRGRFVLQEVPPADAAVPPPAAAEQSGGSSPAAAVALAAAPEPASASASAQAAREPAESRPATDALVSMPAPRKPPERPPAWLTASATPASTSPTASGNGGAGVDPAPSRAYGGLLVAAIRPNIVYAAQSETNFEIEVFVTTRPDGRISSVRITRPSASRVWDDAVVRALEKTERLPPDLNGQVPALIAREGLLVTLRPRDLAR